MRTNLINHVIKEAKWIGKKLAIEFKTQDEADTYVAEHDLRSDTKIVIKPDETETEKAGLSWFVDDLMERQKDGDIKEDKEFQSLSKSEQENVLKEVTRRVDEDDVKGSPAQAGLNWFVDDLMKRQKDVDIDKIKLDSEFKSLSTKEQTNVLKVVLKRRLKKKTEDFKIKKD